jgi:hypothetical protein
LLHHNAHGEEAVRRSACAALSNTNTNQQQPATTSGSINQQLVRKRRHTAVLRLFLTKVATAGIAEQYPHFARVDLVYSFQIG